jgi:hypothetical protein
MGHRLRRAEAALHEWRTAHALLRGPWFADDRPAYEHAVAAVVRRMRPYTSMRALVDTYFDNRRDVQRVVYDVCRVAHSATVLERALVEDDAYWCRLQQLLAGRQA